MFMMLRNLLNKIVWKKTEQKYILSVILQEKVKKWLKIDVFCGNHDYKIVSPPKTYEQNDNFSV